MPTDSSMTGNNFPLNQASVCRQTILPVESAHTLPHFAGVLAQWESLTASDALPRKRDFSPFTIGPKLLPYILLIEVMRNPLRFQYRLTGTKLDRIHNVNLTGTYVSDMRPEAVRADLEKNLETMLQAKQPQFVQLQFTNRAGNHRDFKVLRLPLRCDTADGNDVEFVLVVTDAE